MTFALWRGKVTAIRSNKVYVEIPRLAKGLEFGPCDVARDLEVSVGSRVLCGTIRGINEDIVIIDRLAAAVTPPDDGTAAAISLLETIEQHNLKALRTYHVYAAHVKDTTPGLLDVVLNGDSVSEGWSGTSTEEDSLAFSVFRKQMARVFNPKGRYGRHVPAGANWYSTPKFSNLGSSSESNNGLALRARSMPAGAVAATATVECDQILLFYRLRNAFASANILVKLDTVTQLDTLTYKNTGPYCSVAFGHEVAVWNSGLLVRGDHTLSVEQKTNGGFNGTILWDEAYFCDGDATSGFRLWNASHFGYNWNTFNTNNDVNGNNGYLSSVRQGLIKPRLWIHAHGINEGVDAVAMEAHVRQAIQDVWDACDDGGFERCSQALAIPPATHTKTDTEWAAMRDVYYRVGFELGVAVWDWNLYMGDLRDDADIYALSSDGIHPNSTGQRMYGYFLTERALAGLPDTLGMSDLQSQIDNITLGSGNVQIDRYTTPQTHTAYTVPDGATALTFRIGAGGGGGASGRRGAAGSIRCGGGGGGAGGYTEIRVPTSDLPATLYVTVGSGGVGGAGISTNDTNGNNGGNGGRSDVKTSTAAADFLTNLIAQATGGTGGSGGTNATGAAGQFGVGQFLGANGGAASTTGGAGSAGGTATHGGGGGGSGAGITSGDGVSSGGPGQTVPGHTSSFPAGGVFGGGDGADGSAPAYGVYPGQAGAGGGSSTTGTSGSGGNGARMSGGGGGAASLNGNLSGAGGDGGDGFVEIIAEF